MMRLLAVLGVVADVAMVHGVAADAKMVKCADWECQPGKYIVKNGAVETEVDKACLDVADKTGWYSKRTGPVSGGVNLHEYCKSEGYDTVGPIYLATYPFHVLPSDQDSLCNIRIEYKGAWKLNTVDIFKRGYGEVTFKCVNKPPVRAQCCKKDEWTGDCYSKRSADNYWTSVAWGGATSIDEEGWGNACAREYECSAVQGDALEGAAGATENSQGCADCVLNDNAMRTHWNCDSLADLPTNPPTNPPTDSPTAPGPPACGDAASVDACRALAHCRPKVKKQRLKACKPKRCKQLSKAPSLCETNPICKLVQKRGGKQRCLERDLD